MFAATAPIRQRHLAPGDAEQPPAKHPALWVERVNTRQGSHPDFLVNLVHALTITAQQVKDEREYVGRVGVVYARPGCLPAAAQVDRKLLLGVVGHERETGLVT